LTVRNHPQGAKEKRGYLRGCQKKISPLGEAKRGIERREKSKPGRGEKELKGVGGRGRAEGERKRPNTASSAKKGDGRRREGQKKVNSREGGVKIFCWEKELRRPPMALMEGRKKV